MNTGHVFKVLAVFAKKDFGMSVGLSQELYLKLGIGFQKGS